MLRALGLLDARGLNFGVLQRSESIQATLNLNTKSQKKNHTLNPNSPRNRKINTPYVDSQNILETLKTPWPLKAPGHRRGQLAKKFEELGHVGLAYFEFRV